MKTVKEMLRTDEIKKILIDEFYENKADFMSIYNNKPRTEPTIDDRLNSMYDSLSDIIDSRIKAIESLSGEEFSLLLNQKQAVLNSFNRKYYKNILSQNYSFEELAEQIVEDIMN